ncbi:hypothetical protein LOTGIDRAFT_126607 [Lottia gigantea]|uniref:Snurportin-1 n=1 Tax=Lottia gigantea TaxID=225164 RepID=V4A4B2_LOTGI|nr:hypothetical protein LOTGIDRAFT_126607 [Lottia gigantea]ESO88091.1 hypothetical protein LOTGIDRAFT_126607 [Lottia gigantea]
MDELAAALAGSNFTVTNEPNTTAAEHPRFAQYKCKSSTPSQDKRRQRILESQKKRRFDFQGHVRNLADGEWTVPGQWEQVKSKEDGNEEDMDFEVALRKPSRSYKNQLMLSEWLVEVPEDFTTEWVTVLCPVARRCLVVASRGKTKAYTKSGYCFHTFISSLPGGNRANDNKYTDFTVLDCLYNETDGIYFVLDIMCWKGHPVYESETEFRFYWLQSKIDETPEVQSVNRNNPYKFIPLPNFPCSQEDISIAIATANFEIDGLLFYHKRTHYTIGATPLVVWLKPYMVPEIIGIQIPEHLMDKRPQTYENYQKHLKEVQDTKQFTKNPPSMRLNYSEEKSDQVGKVILSKKQKKAIRKSAQGEGNSMEVVVEQNDTPNG